MEYQFDIGSKVQVNGKSVRIATVKARRIVGEGDKAKIEYKMNGEKDYVSAKSVVAADADAALTEIQPRAAKIELPTANEQMTTPKAKTEKPKAKTKKPKAERKAATPKVKKAEGEMTAKDVVINFLVDTCVAVNPKFADGYIGNHRVSMDGFKLSLPKLNFNAVVKRIGKAIGSDGTQMDLQTDAGDKVGTEFSWKVKGKKITLTKDYTSGAISVEVK